MKRFILFLLSLLAAPAMAQNSPCYWSGQLVKCFPTTGIYLDNSRSVRLGTNDSTHYVELKAANGVASSYTVTWPAAVGASGSIPYFSNGTGTLSYLAAGTTSQVLLGGTPPSFGSVPTGALPAITQTTAGVDTNASQRLATNTNDLASAGNIGQVITQTRLAASATALTTNTVANVTATKLTLSAGDWEIWGVVGLTGTATAGDVLTVGIGTASATLPGVDSNAMVQASVLTGNMDLNVSDMLTCTPRMIVNLAGNTDYYLVVRFRFATGTASAYGQIQARRVR